MQLALRLHTANTVALTILITVTCLGGAHYSHASACDGTVLLLGDSIGAGYGLAEEKSWAAGLAGELEKSGLTLVNASVSGETTAGGLRRAPELIARHQPRLLIVELGGNDGLRGYPISRMKENLAGILQAGQDAGAELYILGMHIPPNYGPRYGTMFHQSYAELATDFDATLLPFLLEGVGRRAELMQADGIHPNEQAQSIILANVLSRLPLDACSDWGSRADSEVGGELRATQ